MAATVRLTGSSTEFHVRHFTTRESLGRPFSIELDLLTNVRTVKVPDLIGEQWTMEIALPKEKKRYFNGHVTHMLSTGPIGGFASYHATLRPTLWFLSLTTNCRIFPNMSVLDIVHELTNKRGVVLDPGGLSESYPAHRYLVQYRESDLDFISRLMEYEGMYYFFKHEDGKHTMMLADSPSSHEAAPGYPEVRYRYAEQSSAEDHIDRWVHGASAQTKKHSLNDYDFKKPNAEIMVKLEASEVGEAEPQDYEQYDFPGAFFDTDRGQNLVAVRQQEAVANAELVRGGGTVRGLASGYIFKLKDAPQNQDGDYLVTSTTCECSAGDAQASGDNDDSFFRCTFSAIKKATQYRPGRVTPKPVISGLQSAKVIGPKGKEIWTDDQGRIRIKFQWQRPEEDAAREEASAIWVRVAQVMAGKGWGALQIPRIGHEVIVSFLEGDPDRPIVTGCVYNDANRPPFNPSAGGMVLGMKSDSTPGHGGYNEMSFDDTKGTEKITIHGQFDMNTTVEHDQTSMVKNNRTDAIVVDDTESVGGNQMTTVVGNQTATIGGNKTTTVTGNHALTIGMASAETIALAKALTIGAAYQVSVGAVMNETVAGAKMQEIGAGKMVGIAGQSLEKIKGGKVVDAKGSIVEKSGADVSMTAAKKMGLNAGDDFAIGGKTNGLIKIKDQLTIKVGSAEIIMKKNGDITIKGKKITVDAGGNIKMDAKKILQNS